MTRSDSIGSLSFTHTHAEPRAARNPEPRFSAVRERLFRFDVFIFGVRELGRSAAHVLGLPPQACIAGF